MADTTPTDVANQALQAVGWMSFLGDIENGSTEAELLLRSFNQCLRQLLRAASWDFARKQATLHLLADATGQTADVGTEVPIPWYYEYEYPVDCMKVRFIPQTQQITGTAVPTGNIAIPSVPLTTGQQSIAGQRLIPARFVIATDANNLPPSPVPYNTTGVSPQGRTVILTNVKEAICVYTALMNYPSVWDPLFREAFVAYLASQIALPLWARKDVKIGMALRGEQIKLAKMKLDEARKVDGNEGVYSSDIPVDWMQTRRTGGSFGNWGGWGPGNLSGYGGFDQCSFPDGTAY